MRDSTLFIAYWLFHLFYVSFLISLIPYQFFWFFHVWLCTFFITYSIGYYTLWSYSNHLLCPWFFLTNILWISVSNRFRTKSLYLSKRYHLIRNHLCQLYHTYHKLKVKRIYFVLLLNFVLILFRQWKTIKTSIVFSLLSIFLPW